ncbi:MBL fold metallo-hydrolase [Acetobacterium woodii]|uniref:Putative hydrolase n=1 Tax=Acetobacterium woodii (strain ATCC 29683 / DSM 1030 / JCM 2381 / KCTC 1655 / WB1) TaxID=931626 RepID=H6LJA7_ACEWD|nr:MBL fold metallo-hydrolase [Acetobacterium woodii]AFA48670.1 putative hydrolase [Acetobacterium woodii DSM 1030]
MYELIQVGKKTYYINCPAKMGIYKINETEVCLIDSGNDKDAGKKVLKIIAANGWTLKMILNTHSHADHIGGNNLLQQRTNCAIYTVGIDTAFTQFPILEPSFLYGGYPCKELRNKFLTAQPSNVQKLTEDVLPKGLEMLPLNGHSFSMAAFKTDDEVWFLADCLTSERIIEKYHVSFLYDVDEYINSLHTVNKLTGKCFIPAHAEVVEDIRPLVKINLNKVDEIMMSLKEICVKPIAFDNILKAVFDRYALTMDFNQNVLVGSTIRSYLAYMHDNQILDTAFDHNKLL